MEQGLRPRVDSYGVSSDNVNDQLGIEEHEGPSFYTTRTKSEFFFLQK